ncbi:MAG: Gfo/Idh/MocA family protein [Nitrososphaerales archaeon]
MEPVNIAIVGLGHWSDMHAGAIKKNNLLKLVTCYTRTEAKAKKFATENNCSYEKSFEDLLKRNDVEAVLLTTPHKTHTDLAVKTAEAGKHLLIEKPMANTVKECKRMIDAFAEAGLVLSVCHDMRWTGNSRKMKEMINQGLLGRLIFAEANFCNPSGAALTPEKWRFFKSESVGGPLAFLGVHMIDQLRYLIDPNVEEVDATFDRMVTKAEIDDLALLNLKFKNGAYGFMASVFTTPRVVYANVFGTGMNLFSGEKTGLYSQRAGTEVREKVEFEETDRIVKEQEDFATSVRERRKPEVDGYEGMQNVAVVEAAVKSAAERRPVKLAEILG